MPPSRPVTLRDVARKAGVSAMTVSRALRKHANISPETRAKVEQVARELGYRPNPLVSALMSYRRAVKPVQLHTSLAFITSFPTRDGWKHLKHYTEFFQGAADAAQDHGYYLEEFWVREPGMTSARLSSVLAYRNISGLLLAPMPVAKGHLRLDWDRFSALTFTYTLARPALHRVVNHQFRSMRTALRQVRKMGYSRVGLAMPASLDKRVDNQWVGSFLVEQRQFASAEIVPLFVIDDKSWNEATFLEWFGKHEPDVIISQQPRIIDWLRKLGRNVPDDVGFVHMNCPDASGEFAGIYQNGPLIGRAAVEFLIGMLHRNERGIPAVPHTVLVEGSWVAGRTLRRV
jgi:LacI family transcriptional regulator